MYLWLLRPLQSVVALTALLGLTYLAAIFRPQALYAEEGVDEKGRRCPHAFLDHRTYIVTLVALVELVTGQRLTGALRQADPAFESAPSVVLHGLYLLLLFTVVGLGALQVWVGSRAAKAPLSMSQSMKVSGYGLVAALTSMAILISAFTLEAAIFEGDMPDFFFVLAAILVVVLGVSSVVFSIYVSFVGPVTAYHPDVDRAKLRFGWLVGMIVGQFLPVLVALLLIAVVALLGGPGCGSR